jgi:2-C-methyl-D-erythritol 4-phosphate cytidylyltransferase
MAKTNKYIVVIPCAGNGSRFGGVIPKQYAKIHQKTVLDYTLLPFLTIDKIEHILLIVSPNDDYIDVYAKLSAKIIIARVGGATRSESIANGINFLSQNNYLSLNKSTGKNDDDWLLIHDAARCCITKMLINKLIDTIGDDSVGGILALPCTDTLKEVAMDISSTDSHNHYNNQPPLSIKKTVDRRNIYLAQTPQMFRFSVLQEALASANNMAIITDDASAVESLGYRVIVVGGEMTNFKVTYASDLVLAAAILQLNS